MWLVEYFYNFLETVLHYLYFVIPFYFISLGRIAEEVGYLNIPMQYEPRRCGYREADLRLCF